MGYDNNEKKFTPIYEKKVRAGKKRTYFFDIKETRNNSYSLIITESRKRFDDRGYDRTSIYIYQEDINKFAKGVAEAIDYIKTELLPDYNFEQYDNEYEENGEGYAPQTPVENAIAASVPKEEIVEDEKPTTITSSLDSEEVDKW